MGKIPTAPIEIEGKEIFQNDLESEGVNSINDAVTDSGVTEDVTKHEVVVVEPEKPAAETPAETSGGPIVDAEIGVDLESGQVETEAAVDTSGPLEEREIADADVSAGDVATAEADVGSAVDISESEVVEEADITTQPLETVVAKPLDVSADVDTTGETIGGEADVGVETEVSDTSENEEVACDPADGLLLSDSSCQSPTLP